MSEVSSSPVRAVAVEDAFALLGARVVAHHCLADESAIPTVPPAEAVAVERAVLSRRAEFAAARACARASLAVLGRPDSVIPANPDRSPSWPSGIVGSISHADGYCIAVTASESSGSVGVDVEAVGRVTDDIASAVMLPSAADPELTRTLVFAAKEALYKAQHPLTRRWLDFHDVEVSVCEAPGLLRLELVGDVVTLPEAAALAWPMAARWLCDESVPGRPMAVVVLVARR
jgi:4'-phosphopantetheinyl transferase EntD